ncbi:MAG: hypothetical protein PVG22_17130 [Chromatiales bacterium]|jgi:hypothetical protein
MQLYVGRLPHKFSKQELYRFIARGTRNKGPLGLLQKNKTTFGCKLMMMRHKVYGETEYFAVVSHIPYKIAQRVIKNLNGKQLNGTVVTVREYRIRNWQNDARRTLPDHAPQKVLECRLEDRRNCWIVTDVKESPHVVVEGIGVFVREYS